MYLFATLVINREREDALVNIRVSRKDSSSIGRVRCNIFLLWLRDRIFAQFLCDYFTFLMELGRVHFGRTVTVQSER